MDGIKGGESVLIVGRVSDDGHTVRLGPGLEIRLSSVAVAAELPPSLPFANGAMLVLIFADEAAREEFADEFIGETVNL